MTIIYIRKLFVREINKSHYFGNGITTFKTKIEHVMFTMKSVFRAQFQLKININTTQISFKRVLTLACCSFILYTCI